MKTNQTIAQLLKASGIAAVALALCLCTAAPSAQTLIAYAEPEGTELAVEDSTAAPAETENVLVGYYATVSERTQLTDPDTNETRVIVPGSYGRNSSGEWVSLSQYGAWISGGAAYIDEADLPALQSAITIQGSSGGSSEGISWRALYKVVPAVQVIEPEQNTLEKPDTKAPETEWAPDKTDTNDSLATPENPQKPTESAPNGSTNPAPNGSTDPAPNDSTAPAPQVTTTTTPNVAADESDLLSIRCRESEAEAKMAELQAQGYEIVRVEKLPKWWR